MNNRKAYNGMRYRFSFFDILVYGGMVLSLLVCIVPFLYMFALSLSDVKEILNNRVGLWPRGFNPAAYQTIFKYPNFFKAYGNTLFYTICGTLIAMTLTVLFGYPLAKPLLRGKKFFLMMVVFSMFFSGGLIPTYLLIVNLHLNNTPLAILLPFAISPFNLIILISFFKGLPREIEEAAMIDGLGQYAILFRIILPLSTAALATVGLYYAVFFWNDWFNALIYLKSSQYPVMLFLRNIVNGTMMIGEGAGSAEGNSLGIAIKAAVIMVSTLPIIILYPLLQRFFITGLTVGGVKG
ncbi:MAG: carbohydrate ABC transporter permease [Spirochaetaceae bacterium]|jgi:putative aldouronate transport system permease protein|nr:carbohydrate ABC transporter permease [Spirochaetaceae bacterium]